MPHARRERLGTADLEAIVAELTAGEQGDTDAGAVEGQMTVDECIDEAQP